MPKPVELALDASARRYDKDGQLHIDRTPICKVGINPYFGAEIPGCQMLGLDPEKVYYLFRSGEEIARGMHTAARKQLLVKHIPVNADDIQEDVIAGTIGSNLEFIEPYLWADVSIWEKSAIQGIENDTVREFSPGYHYVPLMVLGEYNGQKYDGSMLDIEFNHLCLVESGRQGSDVLAVDEDITVKMTKTGRALYHSLSALSPKLALDAALPTLVAQSKRKGFDVKAVTAKVLAMDSEIKEDRVLKLVKSIIALDGSAKDEDHDPKTCKDADCAKCAAMDEDDDQDDMAEDEDEETAAEKKEREDKIAKDAEEKGEKKVEQAMDAFRAELKDAEEARRLVRPIVGDVIAQDTADGIYGFALDHLKVAHKGVTGTTALKALFELGSAKQAPAVPVLALDSATAAKSFPALARFRQA